MKCWHCSEELIWGGDHDSEDDGYVMDTNLHCPVLTVEAGEVVRREGDLALAELKQVLNDHGIRASLSVRIRRK